MRKSIGGKKGKFGEQDEVRTVGMAAVPKPKRRKTRIFDRAQEPVGTKVWLNDFCAQLSGQIFCPARRLETKKVSFLKYHVGCRDIPDGTTVAETQKGRKK